jgi:hypothetical protein
MKNFLKVCVLIALISTHTCFAQSVGQVIRGQNPSGGFTFIQTDSDGILKSNVNIGSATFTFPGAMDISIASHLVPLPSGTNNIGHVNVDGDVTIGSETIGLITAIESIDQISDFDAAYLSVTVGTSAAVIMPSIGTARQVYIFTDQDVNFGGSGVETGTSMPYIPGGAPYVKFKFTKADPAFYFRGRTATAAIRIMKAQE